MVRFEFRYDRWIRWLFVAFAMGPRRSRIDVDDHLVQVRFGWGFRATIDRTSITGVTLDQMRVFGWGVHGFRGRWLVNGSSRGIVRIDIDPRCRAYVLGFPIRLRLLWVSLTDPDGFIAATS